MMKNVLRLLILAILTLGMTATASGQLGPVYEDLIQYQEPIGDPDVSGIYYYCAAKGKWGGYCSDCVLTVRGKECGSVTSSKGCQCDAALCKVTGHCTYEP